MAKSCCPRESCSNTKFEMVEITPSGSNFKYQAIQCSRCGSVVGVVDYLLTASVVEDWSTRLKSSISNLESVVSRWIRKS